MTKYVICRRKTVCVHFVLLHTVPRPWPSIKQSESFLHHVTFILVCSAKLGYSPKWKYKQNEDRHCCVCIGTKTEVWHNPPTLPGPPTNGEPYIGKTSGKEATEPIRFPLGTFVLSESDSEHRRLACVLPLTVKAWTKFGPGPHFFIFAFVVFTSHCIHNWSLGNHTMASNRD